MTLSLPRDAARFWKLAEIGEDILLYAALASELGEVTEDDVKWAKRVLSKAA